MRTKRKLFILPFLISVLVSCHLERNQAVAPNAVISIIVHGESIEMVLVEGGSFMMGCTAEQGNDCEENETAHQEEVSDYYIGKYEVTQRLWNTVMGAEDNRSYNQIDEKCPVENVSWRKAQEFITKLNELTGNHFRLPTDVEWEFAARGGNLSKGYKYSGSNNLDEVAWYSCNYEQDSPTFIKASHPVGRKKPNELGIYDMSGNVWEWCDNLYQNEYQLNGRQVHEGWPYPGMYPSFRRIIKGGSWGGAAKGCRVSYVDYDIETYDDEFGGFRLVMDINK